MERHINRWLVDIRGLYKFKARNYKNTNYVNNKVTNISRRR